MTQNDTEKQFNTMVDCLIGPNKRSFIYSSGKQMFPSIPKEELLVRGIMDSCAAKGVISCVAGAAFGVAMGLFTASVDPMYSISPNRVPTTKEVFLEMKNRSISTAKNFALIGCMFSVIECNIESARGKTDGYNGFSAGFITGGLLGLRAGIKPAIIGGLGFAFFSAAIERLLMH